MSIHRNCLFKCFSPMPMSVESFDNRTKPSAPCDCCGMQEDSCFPYMDYMDRLSDQADSPYRFVRNGHLRQLLMQPYETNFVRNDHESNRLKTCSIIWAIVLSHSNSMKFGMTHGHVCCWWLLLLTCFLERDIEVGQFNLSVITTMKAVLLLWFSFLDLFAFHHCMGSALWMIFHVNGWSCLCCRWLVLMIFLGRRIKPKLTSSNLMVRYLLSSCGLKRIHGGSGQDTLSGVGGTGGVWHIQLCIFIYIYIFIFIYTSKNVLSMHVIIDIYLYRYSYIYIYIDLHLLLHVIAVWLYPTVRKKNWFDNSKVRGHVPSPGLQFVFTEQCLLWN